MRLKLFDKKGRIFGKINLFDIMVMLLLLFCGVVIYVGINYPGRISRIIKGEPEFKSVLVSIILTKDMAWLNDYISVGDFQKGRFTEVAAEIVGKRWISPTNGDKYLVIDLKVKAVIQPGGILTMGGRPLKVGGNFAFQSKKVKFKGYVLEVEDL